MFRICRDFHRVARICGQAKGSVTRHAAGQFEEALLSPLKAPRIFQQPVRLTPPCCAVPHHRHGMVLWLLTILCSSRTVDASSPVTPSVPVITPWISIQEQVFHCVHIYRGKTNPWACMPLKAMWRAKLTWDLQDAACVCPPFFDPVANAQPNTYWVHCHCLLQGSLVAPRNILHSIYSHNLQAQHALWRYRWRYCERFV